MNDEAKRHAPATERNRGPILEVLGPLLGAAAASSPASSAGTRVLEIASGSGQHAAWFASRAPQCVWQPSDPDEAARASIAAWTRDLPNVLAPLALDVTRRPWPTTAADVIVCINMIHIAPWEACVALMDGAAEVLGPKGVLYMYGPYRRAGVETAPSNEAFDARLRAEDPRWGLRALEDVAAVAAERGLRLARVVEMPANNLSVIYERA